MSSPAVGPDGGFRVPVEIAVPPGERGAQFSQELFRQLEFLVSQGRTCRGRIISLDAHIHRMGGGSMVKVDRLAKVIRDDVVLPRRPSPCSTATWLDS